MDVFIKRNEDDDGWRGENDISQVRDRSVIAAVKHDDAAVRLTIEGFLAPGAVFYSVLRNGAVFYSVLRESCAVFYSVLRKNARCFILC